MKKKSQTDWTRVDAMGDEDIDTSDIPETTPEQFARAVPRIGGVAMTETLKERKARNQRDRRDRLKKAGLAEVRGIYAPQKQHDKIRRMVKSDVEGL